MDKIFVPTSNFGKLREFEHALLAQNKSCFGIEAARSVAGNSFDWKTPDEDRETFLGNNCRKLMEALRVLPTLRSVGVKSALVDDSGLCVPRLNFAPGVHSASFAGLPRDDAKNRQYLIEKLKSALGLSPKEKEPAFFVCSLLMASRSSDDEAGQGKSALESTALLSHLESIEPKIMSMVGQRLSEVCSAAYAHDMHIVAWDVKYHVRLVLGICTGKVALYEQQRLEGEGHGYDAMFFPNARPDFSFASIPLIEKNKMSHRSIALRGLSAMERPHTAQDEILELF